MSSSVARMTGPGTVPLYVHAGKKTPGATSMSLSIARSEYSRTRPGSCGRAGGGRSSASRSFGPPGAGASSPIIAAWPAAGVLTALVRGEVLGVFGERELGERAGRDERRRAGEQGAPRHARFRHA